MNTKPKVKYTNVSNEPDVIASIKNNDHGDVIGSQDSIGQWWADSVSLAEWRERQRLSATDRGGQ